MQCKSYKVYIENLTIYIFYEVAQFSVEFVTNITKLIQTLQELNSKTGP